MAVTIAVDLTEVDLTEVDRIAAVTTAVGLTVVDTIEAVAVVIRADHPKGGTHAVHVVVTIAEAVVAMSDEVIVHAKNRADQVQRGQTENRRKVCQDLGPVHLPQKLLALMFR